MKRIVIFSAFVSLILVFKASAQNIISVKNAAKHIGQTVTISDKVYSGRLIKSTGMIILDIGGYEPEQELTVMIPNMYRHSFKGQPEIDYCGKDVIIKGMLTVYQRKPAMVITDPKLLKIVLMDNAHGPIMKASKP
jgi:micrococcal nuclease